MIIENTTEVTESESAKLQVDEKILNFLDYIVLMLSQTNTVDEIDLIMDDFLSNDIFEVMEENRDQFSILSVIWLDAFERVCMKENENNFSLKMLWLPIMFNKLGWRIENQAKLDELRQRALTQTESSKVLYPNLALFFIEGLIFPEKQAMDNFKDRVQKLSNSEDDKLSINQLLEDIATLGWED